MADINEILGRNISSVRELKAAISELQNSLIGVDTESEQFKTTSEQLAAAQAELTKVTKAGKDENNAAADSLVGLRQQYKELYDQYKMLTEEQRNSDFGKSMADSLETLSNKINDTQKGIGDFRGNVGRCAQNITEAFNGMGVSLGGLQTPLKMATGGAKTFGTALKSLAANPIVLVITALVAILVKAAEAIKKNEELSNRLNQAMAALKPVTDALANVLDFLAGMIVKVIEGFSKAVEWISKINPKWNAAVKSHKELAKATNELTKAQRENSVVASQKGAEIEKLREEASATEDVTEKKRLLEEAKRIQQEVDQKEIELAQEELRILEEYSKKTANAAEDNEKLAAAQKKVNDAIAKGEQNMRMYNKQLDAAEKGTSSSRRGGKSAARQKWEDEEKSLEDFEKEFEKSLKTRLQLVEDYYDDLLEKARKHKKDTTNIERARAEELEKIRLDSLKQRREDLEKEWTLNKEQGREELAIAEQIEDLEKKTIPAVEELQKKVRGFLNSFRDENIFQALLPVSGSDAAFKESAKKMREMENLINDETFEALPDEYSEIKKAVKEVNAGFGLSITTVKNLNLTQQELLGKLNELKEAYDNLVETKAGEESLKRISKYLLDVNTSLMDITYNSITGGTSFSEVQENMLKGQYSILTKEKAMYEEELKDFKGSQEQKLQMLEAYYQVVEELHNREEALSELNKQRTEEMVENLINMTDKMAGAMSTYRSSQEALIDSEVKNGKIDEKEARKKKKRLLDLQAAETAFSIATIIADAASASFSIWKGYSTEVGVINAQTAAAAGFGGAAVKAALDAKSLISAIAKQAGVVATAAAQVSAARGGYLAAKNNFEAEGGGGGSVGVAATPALIDSTPYSYARTVQTVEEEDKLNQPIWVSVEDISSALGHQVNVRDESSF